MTEYESLMQEVRELKSKICDMETKYKDALIIILKYKSIIHDYQETNVKYRDIVESLGIRNVELNTSTIQEDGYTDVMNMAHNEEQLKRMMHLFGNVGSRQKASALHLVLDKRILIPSNDYEKLKETLEEVDKLEEDIKSIHGKATEMITKIRDWIVENSDKPLPPEPIEPEQPTEEEGWNEIFNLLEDMEAEYKSSWDKSVQHTK